MHETVGSYRFNIQIEFMDVSMSSSSNSTIVIHHKLHDLSHPKVPFGIKKWEMDVHPDGSKLAITATIHLTAKVRGLSAVLLLLPPFQKAGFLEIMASHSIAETFRHAISVGS